MVSTEVYASADDIRTAMGGASASDDSDLELTAMAVSRWLDAYCGYPDVGFLAQTTATPKLYSADGERYLWIDPCIEVTAVAMKDSVTDTTYTVSFTPGTHVIGFRGDPTSKFIEYNKTPYHGIVILPNAPRSYFLNGQYATEKGFPVHPDDVEFATHTPTVQVTAKWGYASEVPEIIKRATIMQTIRLYKRQKGAMADAVLSGDFNIQQYNKMIDPDIKAMLTFSRLKNSQLGGR